MQNPKSNCSAMFGYRYFEEYVVVCAYMGYDLFVDKCKQEVFCEEF